jgi:hypothetical protein
MCNPLEHGIEIDEMDSNYLEGGCYKCGCDLRWEFKTYFNTPRAYNNMDIAEVNYDLKDGNFNPRNVFAVISQVNNNDADLSLYGAYILPYRSVRIIAKKDKTKQDQSYSIDYTYDDLRYGKNNYYGQYTDEAFSNNSWEKVVKNDIELQQVLSFFNSINKRKI